MSIIHKGMRTRLASGCLLVLLLAATGPVLADPVADFYKSRTVELYVGTNPGGGYDLYGRLVARHIGSHIPGNPSVSVKNMPGAGHLEMVNWI